jgi:PAS domain S-box-containing protein
MNKNRDSFLARRAAIIIFLLGLSTSALLAWKQNLDNRQEIKKAVETSAAETANILLERFHLYQYGLRGTRGAILTASRSTISNELFRLYSQTRDVEQEFPGARGFGFIRRVTLQEEQQFIQDARKEGRPDFTIKQLNEHSGDRYVIQYIEPIDGNLEARGLDIASENNRRSAAEAAMKNGDIRLTGPITLLQASGDIQQSFLMLLPIYRDGKIPADKSARRAELLGWSYAPLAIKEVLNDVRLNNNFIHLKLTDITPPGNPVSFYTSPNNPLSATGHTQLERDVFGRHWKIDFSVLPDFVERLNQTTPQMVFLIGISISTLLSALAAAIVIVGRRQQEILGEQAHRAAIVDSSTDAIISTTLDGIIKSWNKGAEQVFGYTAGEAAGKHIGSLLVPDALLYEETGILEYITQGERIPPFETQRKHRSGRLIDVSITVSPIYDKNGTVVGASKTARDISVQKANEALIISLNNNLEEEVSKRTAELRELNVLFSNVLYSASEVAIVATDTDGIIKIFNHGAERMLGYQAEELVGKTTAEIFHIPEELLYRSSELSHKYGTPVEGFRVFTHKAEIEGAETREWTYVRKDGSQFLGRLVITAMREKNGRLIGYLGIAIDITEQLKLEKSLREAKEQADQANAAKSTFLANMSHEIRTPMNAVLGMLQLIQQTELTPHQRDYVTKAYSAGQSLLGLLNDILDYSKIEAGKLELDFHIFELEKLLLDLGIVLCGNQLHKDVEMMFDVSPTLPTHLVGDSLRLQQVLINLAGNALKFTNQGHVIISLHELERGDNSITLRIAVTDTGIGIPYDQQQRIFESFTQAEASTTRRFGGTGLGLVISKRLLSYMDSDLRVISEPGKGSRFWFDVQFEIEKESQIVTPQVINQPVSLLIVDDDPVVAEILANTVKNFGWHYETVSSGQAAIDHLENTRQRGEMYDIVLMDWRMPDMDGLQTAERLCENSDTTPMPVVIMVTAYGREKLIDVQQQKIQQQENVPFFDLLTKPVTPRQLANAVQKALGAATPVSAKSREKTILRARSQRLAGLHILVVEDNAVNRLVASELLKSEGATVALAEGGAEGVTQVLQTPDAFDVVIMDIQMPDIDGLEATERIRAAGLTELPILAMTANASNSDRAACLAAGMNDHLGKPINLEEVVATVLKLSQHKPS